EVETQYTIMDMMEKFISNPENRYSQVPFNIGLTDRNVLEGLQKYNDALLERMKLEKYTHEDNPIVQMSNEQLEVMRSNILATIRSLKTGFSLTRDDLRKQEDQFLTRLKNMPTQEREFIDIKRQQYLKQELYMFLLQQKEENMLNQSIPTPRASVIDKAYYLNKPLKPKLLNSLMFAMGISFCLSILWINRKKIMTMNNK
ncbi:GNVR domain-containing protein, partial [Bacteroides nordii]